MVEVQYIHVGKWNNLLKLFKEAPGGEIKEKDGGGESN
jgi:hypothetical protein